jgi:hypothetical protein
MCTDGSGSVFLFTDDIHDDPNFDCDPCETGTILRLGLDGTEAIVTQKVTEQSPALACDRGADGRVYWAHYDLFGVDFDEREQLRSIRKTGSILQTHVTNVNLRLGDVDPENYIDPIDGFVYYEPTTTVRVHPDGGQRFVANFFGLYRLDPSPLLITRDVDEVFDVDGNGTILTARAVEQTSEVRVYKLNPSIAIHGAVRLDGITPWASTRIPNNGTSCSGNTCTRSIFITSVAGDRDGSVFVNLLTGDASGVVSRNLRPQGTLRFEPLGDGSSGVAAGFVDLAAVERLDL